MLSRQRSFLLLMLPPDSFHCHRLCRQLRLTVFLFQRIVWQVLLRSVFHYHRKNSWQSYFCCLLLRRYPDLRSSHAYPVVLCSHFHRLPDAGYKLPVLLFRWSLLFRSFRLSVFLRHVHPLLLTQTSLRLLVHIHPLRLSFACRSLPIRNQNMDQMPRSHKHPVLFPSLGYDLWNSRFPSDHIRQLPWSE